MIWNIPNILTIIRLLAAPALAIGFVVLPRGFADWFALILFVGAALTDYVDGYLARKWNQTSKFGAMLDPIADKAMVVIALMVLVGLWTMQALVLIPAAIIVFREVFVSGLREFLGADAGKLAVTKLAKWKTTAQMVAIATLLAQGLFEHYAWALSYGMDEATLAAVLNGEIGDIHGLRMLRFGAVYGAYLGIALIWVASVLTLLTGYDYFRKAMPFLKEPD